MKEIFIKDYYGEYDGMTDPQLFGVCFNQCGPEHPIAELIRRFIVLRNDWAKKEAEFQKAKIDYIAKKKEFEAAHPFITEKVNVDSLVRDLKEAKRTIESDEENMVWIEIFNLNGKIIEEALVKKSENGDLFIEMEFKNF